MLKEINYDEYGISAENAHIRELFKAWKEITVLDKTMDQFLSVIKGHIHSLLNNGYGEWCASGSVMTMISELKDKQQFTIHITNHNRFSKD